MKPSQSTKPTRRGKNLEQDSSASQQQKSDTSTSNSLRPGTNQPVFQVNWRSPADTDLINHPQHYNAGRIEVIDLIDDQQLDFYRGTIVKYLLRAPHKGQFLSDLKKAQWYLNRLISLTERSPR